MDFCFDGTEKHSWNRRTRVHPTTATFAVHVGQLIARWTQNRAEIKCKRGRRVVCILFKPMKGHRLDD